jgi:hypothetical protein
MARRAGTPLDLLGLRRLCRADTQRGAAPSPRSFVPHQPRDVSPSRPKSRATTGGYVSFLLVFLGHDGNFGAVTSMGLYTSDKPAVGRPRYGRLTVWPSDPSHRLPGQALASLLSEREILSQSCCFVVLFIGAGCATGCTACRCRTLVEPWTFCFPGPELLWMSGAASGMSVPSIVHSRNRMLPGGLPSWPGTLSVIGRPRRRCGQQDGW